MTFPRRWAACCSLVIAALAPTFSLTAALPQRPYPEIEHVCIISIDGLRPDRALIANMPNFRSLLATGSYTFWAKTTPNSITLPSHVSMLTGVSPRKHGVEWNRNLPLTKPVYPLVPTIFELATQVGYSTAAIAGKSKFSIFDKPGALTYSAIAQSDTSKNEEVVAAATQIIEEHQPQLIFIHFPEVDNWGHAKGWGSPEQLDAIERTDVALGKIFAAFERAGIRKSTFIIVTSDHGGAGRSHGPDDPRSRFIPWVASGPGVREKFDLTQLADLEVTTEDSAATALYLLGIELPKYLDGKPVREIFSERR
jgi:predicted AlkP superfamily pyrophosphatase or phosphodiesterase